jgi:hypothetical protein
MKTLINTIAIVAILFAVNAKAGNIDIYSAGQQSEYNQLAGGSEWALSGEADWTKEKAGAWHNFTITNMYDQYREADQKVGNAQGTYKMDDFDGNGAGYNQALNGMADYVGMAFSHNSANMAVLSLPTGLINSFALEVATHANENSTQGTFNMTITTAKADGSDAGSMTFKDIAFGWAGFVLEDDYYITGFTITQNSNKNTGFYFNFVPGDGTALAPETSAETPEPATMLLFALGLAVIPAARRMRK